MSSLPRISTQVGWIPAHPIYEAVSMRRYWQALSESLREEDFFKVHSIIEPHDISAPPGIRGNASRYWQRKFAYPAEIRKNFRGSIAHVLDHSWADMLRHVPKGVLKVATVHDLIPLRFPGELSPSQAKRFKGWIDYLTDADAVIAVSVYTKQELLHFMPIPEEKIRVIPCGVNLPAQEIFEKSIPNSYAPSGSILVGSIGSAISRKNLEILPEALERLKAKVSRKISLVRVGAALPLKLAEKIKASLGEEGLVELGYLSDAEVGDFYRSMDMIVVPSLYEGFGLPVLESLAWGTPVISSNATSLPEVGGEEAVYFDPRSPSELAARMEQIVVHGVPEGWKSRAIARAATFSWRSSLEKIYSVYETVLEKKHG